MAWILFSRRGGDGKRLPAKMPFWAAREFRVLILILVTAASILAVLVVEILPLIEARNQRGDLAKPFPPSGELPKDGDSESPEELLGGALKSVNDESPIDEIDEPYLRLAEYVSKLNAEALSKEAHQVDYSLFKTMPSKLRGRVIRVTALFLDSKPIALEKKAEGVEFVYRSFLLDPAGNEGFVVDLVQPPPPLEQLALVTVNAIFLKVVTYEGGKGPREAPLFLARGLRLLKQRYPANTFSLGIGTIVLSAGLLSLVLLSATILIQRQARGKRHPRLLRSPKRAGETPHIQAKQPPKEVRETIPPHLALVEASNAEAPLLGREAPRKSLRRFKRVAAPTPRSSTPRKVERYVFWGIVLCTLLLLGMISFNLYQRLKPVPTVTLDLTLEWKKAFDALVLRW